MTRTDRDTPLCISRGQDGLFPVQPRRLDYGLMPKHRERHFNPADRRQILWDDPRRPFGFATMPEPQ